MTLYIVLGTGGALLGVLAALMLGWGFLGTLAAFFIGGWAGYGLAMWIWLREGRGRRS